MAWLQRLDAQVVPQGAAVWEELRASDAKRAPDAASPLVARLPPPGLNRHIWTASSSARRTGSAWRWR